MTTQCGGPKKHFHIQRNSMRMTILVMSRVVVRIRAIASVVYKAYIVFDLEQKTHNIMYMGLICVSGELDKNIVRTKVSHLGLVPKRPRRLCFESKHNELMRQT